MHFMLTQDGWHCQFLKDDLKTSLPRKLTFQDPDKLIDIARKGGAEFTSAERQALEFGISRGRGAVWLNLTAEQLNKLKRLRMARDFVENSRIKVRLLPTEQAIAESVELAHEIYNRVFRRVPVKIEHL